MADLGDEVDVFLILRLLALASLVFPVEVEETAGQDEVPTGVSRPAAGAKDKNTSSAKQNDNKSSGLNVLCLFKILVKSTERLNITTRWEHWEIHIMQHRNTHTFTCA